MVLLRMALDKPYTFGKFGIIADITGDAFPEDVFCIPICGTNGQELLLACFFR